MLKNIIIVSLAVTFIILTLTKMGLREELMKRSNRIFYQLLGCDFCLGFWMSCFISLFLFVIFEDISFLYIPFLSAPLIRILL